MTVRQVIQPNGSEIGFIYDENNRLVTIEKPDKNTIHYEDDDNGNKTKIIVKTKDVNDVEEEEDISKYDANFRNRYPEAYEEKRREIDAKLAENTEIEPLCV